MSFFALLSFLLLLANNIPTVRIIRAISKPKNHKADARLNTPRYSKRENAINKNAIIETREEIDRNSFVFLRGVMV